MSYLKPKTEDRSKTPIPPSSVTVSWQLPFIRIMMTNDNINQAWLTEINTFYIQNNKESRSISLSEQATIEVNKMYTNGIVIK